MFVDFVNDMESILTTIQSKTKAVYVPIAIQISPLRPDKDFTVVFRNHTSVKCIPLKGWFTEKIPDLAKKIVHKVEPKKLPDIGMQYFLEDKLKEWYTKENLRLIGGFHDGNNLKLLLYKEDK